MSSGHGRVERAILASLLPVGRSLLTSSLARDVFQLPRPATVTASQLASVRRACGTLRSEGKISRDRSQRRWRRIDAPDAAEMMRHAAVKSPVEDREFVTVEQWYNLDQAARAAVLSPQFSGGSRPGFNKQESADIEWAQWSWNPITGCLHTCSYCYAREIANSPRMAQVYPLGFEPVLHPWRLPAPRFMKVPTARAATDMRHRNVFVGSMTDMFGRWVPAEWIDAVLAAMRAAPQWNFLCLTKFPKRMAEFEIPENVWMGTSVDLQARVAAAEAAFAHVGSKVRWLSCEPLIEPLRFEHLERFHWIVIGGASATDKTPDWHPPRDWVIDLERQARAAGLKVYEKTNLIERTIELPYGAPAKADPIEAPAVFHYLRP